MIDPIEVPDLTVPPHLLVYPAEYSYPESTDPEAFFIELTILGSQAHDVRCQLIQLIQSVRKESIKNCHKEQGDD